MKKYGIFLWLIGCMVLVSSCGSSVKSDVPDFTLKSGKKKIVYILNSSEVPLSYRSRAKDVSGYTTGAAVEFLIKKPPKGGLILYPYYYPGIGINQFPKWEIVPANPILGYVPSSEGTAVARLLMLIREDLKKRIDEKSLPYINTFSFEEFLEKNVRIVYVRSCIYTPNIGLLLSVLGFKAETYEMAYELTAYDGQGVNIKEYSLAIEGNCNSSKSDLEVAEVVSLRAFNNLLGSI